MSVTRVPRRRRGTSPGLLLVALVPAAFLGVFFLYPLATILLEGLRPDGTWHLGVVGEVAGDADLRRIALVTVALAATSTVLTVLAGLPSAWVFARLEFQGRRLAWALLVVPFVLPTVVVGAAFRSLLGAGTEGVGPVLAAHVFFNLAVVIRTVGGFWGALDPGLEQTSRSLGAGPVSTFRRVSLPLIRPAIAAAASIVFLFTLTSFGVILTLGGPRLRTVETEIYRQTTRFLALDVAAVLCLAQLVAVVAVLVVWSRWQARHQVTLDLEPGARSRRRAHTTGDRVGLAINAVVLGVLALPIAALVWRALTPASGVGLANFEALGDVRAGTTSEVAPVEAIRNSLVIAGAATAVALVVGVCAAVVVARRGVRWVGWFDAVLMLPLGTSAVTIGFAFLLALDEPPLDLRRSVVLLPIAHALVAVPLVVRICAPAFGGIDPTLREAAALLGAGPLRAWRTVDLPLAARAVAVSAGFAFAVSLGEFGATLFLARAELPTLPLLVYRALGQPGEVNRGVAYAASVVLALLVAVVVLCADGLAPERR